MRPFDQVRLGTERLALRPFRVSDAEALFAIFSDLKVMRYWSGPPWTSVAQAHELIEVDLKAMPKGEHLRLGIELQHSGELIGMCTLFQLKVQCRRAEIGYGLASPFWGFGYMHESLSALLHFGFRELDLNRVEADVDPRNEASIRSLQRLGFRKEGHLRERWIVEGEVSDSGIYGLLRKEWASGPGHPGADKRRPDRAASTL